MSVERGEFEVHMVANLWAVGDDDHRFATEAEAREYAEWLEAGLVGDIVEADTDADEEFDSFGERVYG